MSLPPEPNYPPIKRSSGVTPAENYLGYLCENTFLSLWSYPTIYRDQRADKTGDGKEICDLLVVFGNDVIIFSDKHCEFPNTGHTERDWIRWFRPAVLKSAQQVWGAERWVRSFPSRIFLDRKCERNFPIALPEPDEARFHLIVVAHGVSQRCKKELGGSGSLMILTGIRGEPAHTTPFFIGDLDAHKTFVHVLDDTSLGILMGTLDTVADFTRYLRKKESFLRSGLEVLAAGEEELLASYLKVMNPQNEHDFVVPDDVTGVAFDEGGWDRFRTNPQRLAQIEANKISYSWDLLIEKFSGYALRGTQEVCSPPLFSTPERILRFLAREPRFRRRVLAKSIIEALESTPADMRRIRVVPPMSTGDPYYVFLLLPTREKHSYEANRTVRLNFLEACCKVVKLQNPDALDIVGIATETGLASEHRSEDVVYLDARTWNDELTREAREVQKNLKILVNARELHFAESEYPEVSKTRDPIKIPKNPRNKPCPCGSGKKYKKCHGSG
jgi:SEC-C motif